jgi:hypothetical protein
MDEAVFKHSANLLVLVDELRNGKKCKNLEVGKHS